MQKSSRIAVLATSLLVAAVFSRANADVALDFRLPNSSVIAGRPVAVELFAVAASETVGVVKAVISWDPVKLSLIEGRVDPPAPTNPWQSLGYPMGGLNADFSDGKAFFEVTAVPCQTLTATSAGAHVATLYFTALESTSPTTTAIEILPSFTNANGTFTTEVWDQLGPLFCGGVTYPTVPLGSPVNLTIFACVSMSNCDDADTCTDDDCVAGVCTSTPNFEVGVECCNPGPDPNSNGTPAGGIEIIDDGSECTTDSCDVSTGEVRNTALTPGTPCDADLNVACTPTHTCDSVGVCQPNHAPPNSFCDDGDDCTQISSCDGAGNCVGSDPLGDGSGCNDGNDCTEGETCLGGVCQGGTDPCAAGLFCDPDGNGNTGVPCPPTCPTGQSCIDGFCNLPFACLQCRPGMGLVDCPDDGDCLLMSCVAGVCLENAPNDGVCQNSSFCDGREFCQQQSPTNWTCQPAANPDPCSSSPNTPVCDETNDICVECLSSVDCDFDPCFVEICDTGTSQCLQNPLPVDCSSDNTDCAIGVCLALGGCQPVPAETVTCVVPADCSFFEPTRYSCIGGFCATVSCDDGEDCTSSDRCQFGVCLGDPPVTDGTVDLVWLPASQGVDTNATFTVDLFASLNFGTSENLNTVEVLLAWDPDLVALTANMDPCAAEPCPPGQYDWSGAGSFFPIGGFDSDGINTACGGAEPPCPNGRACVNGRCNDGDAFLLAQRRLGDPVGAPVTSTDPLWITTIEFIATFPSGLSGTNVDVASCIASTTTQVLRAGGGVDPNLTGALGSTNVVIGCLTDPDCDDNDACTDDVCQVDLTCLSTPNFTVGIDCCNPSTGLTTPIDDVNDCTNDSCNASTGVVTHAPVAQGSTCDSAGDTECDNPDTCDAVGNCLDNNEPNGLACNDEGNDCTDDVCGGGVCTHPSEPVGTSCGSSADTDCDNPDTCNASGTCLANNEPNGTSCPDEGSDCTSDVCGSGICTHPNLAGGTACGDASVTTCSARDTCDGAGNCDPNDTSAGVSCGDAGESACDHADSCDGSGNCDVNFEPAGTGCDDSTFCNGIDSCDGGGVCLHAGPPCATCECITAVDCSVGACVPCVDCIDAGSDICETETQCPCDPPIVTAVGSRYLAVTPLPVDSGQPMKIRVSSPRFPCLSKYVSGPLRCDGTGKRCNDVANCNQCSVNGDPCLQSEDCFNFPQGEICVISGLLCIPGPVEPFDINGDSIADGMLATLTDDPGNAAVLTPAEWGATLNKCSLTYTDCATDTDCDHGICIHAGCGTQLCDTPCSVAAQDCDKFCDDPVGVGCSSAADCAVGGTCIAPVCERDETCIPGRVYITGVDIVPSDAVPGGGVNPTIYDVVVDCGVETAPVSAEMWVWCDVNKNDVVNFGDVQMAVFAFQGLFGFGNGVPNSLAGTDLVGSIPCSPEQVTNFSDIGAQIFAFQGQDYLGRLDAGSCADASTCSVSAQDCSDASTCTRPHTCAVPCAP